MEEVRDKDFLAVMVEEFKIFKIGKSPFGVLVEHGEQLRKIIYPLPPQQ